MAIKAHPLYQIRSVTNRNIEYFRCYHLGELIFSVNTFEDAQREIAKHYLTNNPTVECVKVNYDIIDGKLERYL